MLVGKPGDWPGEPTAELPAASGDSSLKRFNFCLTLPGLENWGWGPRLKELNWLPQIPSLYLCKSHTFLFGWEWGAIGNLTEMKRYFLVTRECNIPLLIPSSFFFFYDLPVICACRSAFWEFYSRGYVPLLLSVWSRQRLLWPYGKLQMWDSHGSVWVHLWEGVLRERSPVRMHRWVSGLWQLYRSVALLLCRNGAPRSMA